MGLFDRIPVISRTRRSTLPVPASRSGAAGSSGDGLAPSQLPVDRQLEYIMGDATDRGLALTVAALHRCVTLIAASVAEVVANSAHVVDFDSPQARIPAHQSPAPRPVEPGRGGVELHIHRRPDA